MFARCLFLSFLLWLACGGTAGSLPDTNADEQTFYGASLLAPGDYSFDVPGWTNRAYDLHVPAGYSGVALPLVLGLHGGGSDKKTFARQTCRYGDLTSPTCLSALADREGFFVL